MGGYKHPDKVNPFYFTPTWKAAREAAAARDNYLCQRCLKRGRITPFDLVHHIEPLELRPDLALVLENLLSLCWSCHNIVEPRGPRRGPKKKRRARVIKAE